MANFEKKLTATDATSRLSVPIEYLNNQFFELPADEKWTEFEAVDADNEGLSWIFRLNTRREGPKKPVIERGWMTFVRDKKVRVDDTVEFSKEYYHNQATATPMSMRYRVKVTKIFYDFLGVTSADGLRSDDLTLVSRG